MATVFQEPLLLNSSVRDNIETFLRIRGSARRDLRSQVRLALARFGVDDLLDRSARTLSGGEAQRVSLARAFALEPEVIFLDEPFSALDAPTRAALATDLVSALRATGTTAVVVTHDRDEALTLGDRLAVLIGGQLRQVDTPSVVFGTPADPEVAAFVGVETIWPATVGGGVGGLAELMVGGTTVTVATDLPQGAAVLFCLRPEDVTLFPDGEPAASSARNRLSGRIRDVAPLRGQVRVTIDCGFPLVALVTRRSADELGLGPGVRIAAAFKATAAHLIARQ